METSAMMVNGQGDGPAKRIPDIDSEKEVAAILDNIASIMDDRSDTSFIDPQQRTNQNVKHRLVLKANPISSEGSSSCDRDKNSTEVNGKIENKSESFRQSPPSLSKDLNSKKSSDQIKISQEPDKTACGSTVIIEAVVPSRASCLTSSSSSSSSKCPEHRLYHSTNSKKTSHFPKEDMDGIHETLEKSLALTVSSPCASTELTLNPVETIDCSTPPLIDSKTSPSPSTDTPETVAPAMDSSISTPDRHQQTVKCLVDGEENSSLPPITIKSDWHEAPLSPTKVCDDHPEATFGPSKVLSVGHKEPPFIPSDTFRDDHNTTPLSLPKTLCGDHEEISSPSENVGGDSNDVPLHSPNAQGNDHSEAPSSLSKTFNGDRKAALSPPKSSSLDHNDSPCDPPETSNIDDNKVPLCPSKAIVVNHNETPNIPPKTVKIATSQSKTLTDAQSEICSPLNTLSNCSYHVSSLKAACEAVLEAAAGASSNLEKNSVHSNTASKTLTEVATQNEISTTIHSPTIPLDLQDDHVKSDLSMITPKISTGSNVFSRQQSLSDKCHVKELIDSDKLNPQDSNPKSSCCNEEVTSLTNNISSELLVTTERSCCSLADISTTSSDDAALLNSSGNKDDEKLNESKEMELGTDANDFCSIQILESLSITGANGFNEEEMTRDEVPQRGKIDNGLLNTAAANDESESQSVDIPTESCEESSDEKVNEGNSSVCETLESMNTEQGEMLVNIGVNEEVVTKSKDQENMDTPLKTPKHSVLPPVEKVPNFVDEDESGGIIVLGEEPVSKSTNDATEEKKSHTGALKASVETKEVAKLEDISIGSKKIEPVKDTVNAKKDELSSNTENDVPNEENNSKRSVLEVLKDKLRKRSFSPEEISSVESKRQKLDEPLKGDVLEKPQSEAMEVIDSDDDVILTEDTPPKLEVSKTDKDSTEVDVKDIKDIKSNVVKDEKGGDSVKTQCLSPTNLTNQVLQAFITARIKAFIKKQKQQQIDKLSQRISVMQSSTSLWKETAKHLERSVKEVTVLNQGVEKRKAHVNACKKLSSRTVGTQVSDDKVKSALTTVQNSSPSQGRGLETAVANSSLGPSILLNPPTPQQLPQQRQYGYPQQVYPPAARPQVPPTRPMSPRQSRPPAPTASRPAHPPHLEVVNLIDLTDDDEGFKKGPPSKTPAAKSANHPVPLNNRTNVTTSSGGGKAAPVGGNGFIPTTQNRPPLAANGQQEPSGAGPQSQTHTSTAASNQSQKRPASKLAQLPNHPLASGSVPGQPSAIRLSSRAAVPQSSASGKQAQESQNASLTSKSNWITKHTLPPSLFIQQQRHPAPLPQPSEALAPNVRALKLPPKPTLKISRVSQGIVLSWNMPSLLGVEVITSYQLFAYQETESAPKTSLWKKVGDVRALPLPMACTLTQFLEGNKYHFAVRAVDKYSRTGAFSDPSSIFLGVGSTNTKIPLRG